MKKRKFRKGRIYTKVEHVAIDVSNGEWIYFNDKILHCGFVVSMTLKTIINGVNCRFLRRAIPNA
jgi:hypothetical protein